MPHRIAYMPLDTYPEAGTDTAILSALAVAAAFGCKVHVSTFTVAIPPVASPIGGRLINIEGMARATEERSRAEARRLRELLEAAPQADRIVAVRPREADLGGALAAAAAESRHFDLTVLPWSADAGSARDMAQALVFDSGLPVLLVPAAARAEAADHIAIAWDDSRVAARALADALCLLAPGGRVSVLTVRGEKALSGTAPAQDLAASLRGRGYEAEAVDLSLNHRPIADVLQEGALAAGARLLAMGGFGHSRLRDFILGGATKGVLSDLRLPVLLSH